ncbi:MAG: hypothetical protein AAGI24_10415 [Pseudomonadota bacterium]
MEFSVPQGSSAICHFDVYPEVPANGVAQPWRTVLTSGGEPKDVDLFDIRFAKASAPSQRQCESLVMVFRIADAAQSEKVSWRWLQSGVMFCEGQGDYLDRITFEQSCDNAVLTATVSCLSDLNEDFHFSFIGLMRNTQSGACEIYASEDPVGRISRW